MAQSAIPEDQVRDQLKKILASHFFQPSELQSKFLRFTVEKTLSGEAEEIKEYGVGAEAFGRGTEFDPRIDSVVRVVARRVRDKLDEYYATDGRQDPILIHLAKGGYVPSFSFRGQPTASSPGPAEPSPEIPDRAGLTGRIISHYEVLGLLGQGSKASVYRAEDLRLKRGVALKFLSETFAADPAWTEYFRREAQSASAASHPGICGVYDVGDYQGRPYIVLELIEGDTLGQFIHNQPLPVDTLVDLGLQIADALAMANAQGIIHRDVRPGNIIVNRRGKAKLLDFGMAEALPRRAQTAAVADVTPAVSEPEPRTRGDVAGIGAILYEMATGQSPSTGGNTSPRLLNPAFPPELDRLIHDAITANPRLRSVSDIVDELNNFKKARDLAQSGAYPLTLANLGKLIRLKRVWTTAIAAVLLGVAGYSFLRPISPPRILKYTQLTHDAQGKLESFSAGTPPPLMTDGSRLYFTEVSGSQIIVSEVSASGGETVPLRPDLKQPLVLMGISPDESELLATNFFRASPDEPLRILPLPGGIPRPIGNLVGHDGAWSEDGSRICYAKENHLYVVRAEGGGSKMLASLPGLPSWPRWSPDGSKLRFTVQDVDGGTSLWEVSEDGNNPHPLLPNWNGHPAECCGSWNPDGKYFVSNPPGKATRAYGRFEKAGGRWFGPELRRSV